jgi:replicative DNA helicase
MVCFIHRPEYYKIYKDQYNNDLKGIAEIIIAKHRNGAVGDVRLRFRGEHARFMNLDDEVPPMPSDDGTIKPTPSKFNNESGDSFDGLDISSMPSPAPF